MTEGNGSQHDRGDGAQHDRGDGAKHDKVTELNSQKYIKLSERQSESVFYLSFLDRVIYNGFQFFRGTFFSVKSS